MKNIIKNQVKEQLKGKQLFFFGLLISINVIMIGFRVFTFTMEGSTSVLYSLSSNIISLLIALINGVAWIYFIRVARNQSVKFKELDITFTKALYLMLTAFMMDFLVLLISFITLFVCSMIPGIGSFIYLFITAMISIIVIPINGYLAFQINDGEYKVMPLFKTALSYIRSNMNDAIRVVLPYYIFSLSISFVSSMIYMNLFASTDFTNIYLVVEGYLNQSVAMPQLLIALALEVITIVGGAYFLMRVYLGLANLYDMIKGVN